MIKISNLTKTFNLKNSEVKALQDVNLHIKEGEIFGIIGMSGAGKSTLLRCLSVLEKPTSGSIVINGVNTSHINQASLTQLRRDMGVIFQGYNLLMQKTVYENIAFPFKLLKVTGYDQRVQDLLKIVGLEDKKEAYPSQLSGGQKQRVAIARALATNPKVLLCDEPTSALDPKTKKQIVQLLKQINKELNITIIIITHELSLVRVLCDKVAVIDEGTIKEEGVVSDVFENPSSTITKNLLEWEG